MRPMIGASFQTNGTGEILYIGGLVEKIQDAPPASDGTEQRIRPSAEIRKMFQQLRGGPPSDHELREGGFREVSRRFFASSS